MIDWLFYHQYRNANLDLFTKETRKRLGARAVHMKMSVCYFAFTVTICVSMAVVESTTEGFRSGNLAISGMIFFILVSFFLARLLQYFP